MAFHHTTTAGAKELTRAAIPFVWSRAPKDVSKDFFKAASAGMAAMESQLTENIYISARAKYAAEKAT